MLPEETDRWVDAETGHDIGIWRWDVASGRVEMSARLREICGVHPRRESASIEEFLTMVHSEDRERVARELDRATAEHRAFSFQTRIHRSDNGQERTLLYRGSPSQIRDGDVEQMLGICRDISSRMATASFVDQLERRLSDIIDKSPSLISIKDLHHRYRMANTDIATLAGKDLTEVIGHTATEVFPDIGAQIDAQAAEAVATGETIHGDVDLEVGGQMRTFHLVSFALTDSEGRPVEVCCIATDVTDSYERGETARLRQATAELVSSALRDNRIVAYRQPVIRISDGVPVSEELLIRLAPPQGGELLPPVEFLPLAERFGLVQTIDTWMVSRALRIAAIRRVQVNLSAVTLSDAHARERIVSLLQERPAAAARIDFEITETAAAHHLDAACAFASELTQLGCGLALDDFGTGFGSFTYLRRLPLRYLKIDRSFVTELPASADDRRVVSSIVSIARQFELLTIAEGVEDADTLRILGELGADFAQGFYIGRPGPL